jgi:hypothetical protein
MPALARLLMMGDEDNKASSHVQKGIFSDVVKPILPPVGKLRRLLHLK